MITVPATGDQRVDKAFQIVCAAITKLSNAISRVGLGSDLDKRFELISEAINNLGEEITTKTLRIGDVAAGNYVEIKETGEIELHGTNTLQINSGELYLRNGATLERIRVNNGQFYIENRVGSSWIEFGSFF